MTFVCMHLTIMCLCMCGVRLFEDEVERSSHLNQLLGVGIGLFQGLSNIALNGICLSVWLSDCMCILVYVRVSWTIQHSLSVYDQSNIISKIIYIIIVIFHVIFFNK